MTEYFAPGEDSPAAAIAAIGEELTLFDDWLESASHSEPASP